VKKSLMDTNPLVKATFSGVIGGGMGAVFNMLMIAMQGPEMRTGMFSEMTLGKIKENTREGLRVRFICFGIYILLERL